MLLETGGEVRFETRPVEGVGPIPPDHEPERLILDGQQRLTTLMQAVGLESPVQTRTNKGTPIQRHYYFDINMAIDMPHALDEAVIAVDENRQRRTNFGRDIELDLSTRELECQQLYFPCDQIMNSDKWEETLFEIEPSHLKKYMEFRQNVINAFRQYHLPVIELKKETSKEAVCLVI